MKLHHIFQTLLLPTVLAFRKDARQVIVTVTVSGTPPSASAPDSEPLSAPSGPWGDTSSTSSSSNSFTAWITDIPPSLGPAGTIPSAPESSTDSDSAEPTSDAGSGFGPKCGKGFTYCGYMLTGDGHNFTSEEVDKAYCDGLPELCSNGKHKTDIGEAVFVCMSNQPSTVELMCACSGTCLNNATSNYIAHCDTPCVNS